MWVFMSKPMSLFIVITLVTISSIKESAVARGGLARWHWKGIWVFLGVINIFLVAKLAIYHTKSVIYIISLNVIKEPITITTKLNST